MIENDWRRAELSFPPLLLFFLLLLLPWEGNAKCNLGILFASPTIDFDVNPKPQISFQVTRKNPQQECEYWIGVTPGTIGSYNRKLLHSAGPTIAYGVFSSPCTPTTPGCQNPQMKDGLDAQNASEVIRGSFTKGQGANQNTHTLHPTFPLEFVNELSTTHPIKPWGIYRDQVEVRLYEGVWPPDTRPNPRPEAEKVLLLSKFVAKFATISIVNSGSPYQHPPVTHRTVDFGTLTAGEFEEFDLISLFNAGYDLKVASENGSRLASSGSQTTVQYQFLVNNTPIGLPKNQRVTIASSTGISPPPTNGVRHRVRVTIDGASLSRALAGSYSDTLTLTITSIE